MSQGLELQFYKEKLIRTVLRRLPRCQSLLDRVLDCSPFEIFPSDCLAQAAMSNALKESFQVYIVNRFFDLTGPMRALACSILKRASQQSQELHDLYEHCETIIGNKNLEYPSVQIVSIKAAGSKLPAIMDYLTRSTKMQSTKTGTEGQGEKDDHTSVTTLSLTLFSCIIETKISNVWVVFDEEESAESQVSIERLFIKGAVSNHSQRFRTLVVLSTHSLHVWIQA